MIDNWYVGIVHIIISVISRYPVSRVHSSSKYSVTAVGHCIPVGLCCELLTAIAM
jgi:hypothetical protein